MALLALFAMLVAAPALASASDGMIVATAEETDAPTVTEAPDGPVPAVEAPAASEEEEEAPWTSRFLVPTVLALGALSVVAAAGFYIVRIRGRYRVV